MALLVAQLLHTDNGFSELYVQMEALNLHHVSSLRLLKRSKKKKKGWNACSVPWAPKSPAAVLLYAEPGSQQRGFCLHLCRAAGMSCAAIAFPPPPPPHQLIPDVIYAPLSRIVWLVTTLPKLVRTVADVVVAGV